MSRFYVEPLQTTDSCPFRKDEIFDFRHVSPVHVCALALLPVPVLHDLSSVPGTIIGCRDLDT